MPSRRGPGLSVHSLHPIYIGISTAFGCCRARPCCKIAECRCDTSLFPPHLVFTFWKLVESALLLFAYPGSDAESSIHVQDGKLLPWINAIIICGKVSPETTRLKTNSISARLCFNSNRLTQDDFPIFSFTLVNGRFSTSFTRDLHESRERTFRLFRCTFVARRIKSGVKTFHASDTSFSAAVHAVLPVISLHLGVSAVCDRNPHECP